MNGILKQVICKKDGRVTQLHLLWKGGMVEIKASKYLRVGRGYTPSINDSVELKILKKMKAGRVKLKAFAIAPSNSPSQGIQKMGKRKKNCKPLRIEICQSSKCKKRGAQKLWDKLEKELSRSGRTPQVQLTTSKCLGQCKKGPAAKLPSGRICSRLDASTVLGLLPSD